MKDPSTEAQDAVHLHEIIRRRAAQAGGLLPALHDVQEAHGYIPPELVPFIADAFNVSRAEVHGVITFYPDFRQTPPSRHTLKVCRAEACQARGGTTLAQHAEQRLGCALGSATADGSVTLEPVYCLGLCAQGPAVMLDGAPHAHMNPERLDTLIQTISGAEHSSSCSQPAQQPAISTAVQNHTELITVYVPRDAAALAAGADEVARRIAAEAQARGLSVRLVRNGSRGMLWLEPLVEVATAEGRVAYGPVRPEDVSGLFDADMLRGGSHPLCHGRTDDLPWLRKQERLTFARVGITDPISLDDYAAHDGWTGLRRAIGLLPQDIVDEVTQSGLRGRGGAAFPTGIKWKTVLDAPGASKYVVCNADEGDSGTFADRMLMEGDPYLLIEGMIIAGLAVGATQGYVYVRSEYPHAIAALDAAIERATAAGYLGNDILGSGRSFYLEVRVGAGAYICGEETSLLESLEGKRGVVRAKPPLPALQGLFGEPTVVNNVLSLAAVPYILAHGAAAYRDFGVGRSRGTQAFQLAGDLKQGGLVEKAFGVTLRELLYDFGGGSASGRSLRAVQVGGPLGAYLPESQWDMPLDYEAYAAASAMLGHGGIVAFNDGVDMRAMARYAMEFCAVESCGKCTPCRIGSIRGVETLDKIGAGGPAAEQQVELLRDLCDTMMAGSLCALGGMAPYPVLSALEHFSEDFGVATPAAASAH